MGQCCEIGAKGREVQSCNLLIKLLRQKVDLVLVTLVLLPVLQEIKLSKDLIGEGAGPVTKAGSLLEREDGCQQDAINKANLPLTPAESRYEIADMCCFVSGRRFTQMPAGSLRNSNL